MGATRNIKQGEKSAETRQINSNCILSDMQGSVAPKTTLWVKGVLRSKEVEG